MYWDYLQSFIKYSSPEPSNEEILSEYMNEKIIDVTDDIIYRYPEIKIKNLDDDDEKPSLLINSPEPSITPEPSIQPINIDIKMKIAEELNKIFILHKIKQINQDLKLRNDYDKKYNRSVFNKTIEYIPTKIEMMEIKLAFMGMYCLGLTVVFILCK